VKGVVLAGGTGSRLDPLTRITNKHLLPIYDRPMIYYPIETLAGMGIREVMVIVGGKSVGDVVELLGDGSHFGLDLTYRYQGGPLGIAHAIGQHWVYDQQYGVALARRFHHNRPPTILDAPQQMAWAALDIPDPETPVGSRGVGEAPVGAGFGAVVGGCGEDLVSAIHGRIL